MIMLKMMVMKTILVLLFDCIALHTIFYEDNGIEDGLNTSSAPMGDNDSADGDNDEDDLKRKLTMTMMKLFLMMQMMTLMKMT